MIPTRPPNEFELQRYSADVFRLFGVPGVVGWHTPNGEYRDPATAVKLKDMGVLPGVPDWTFIRPGMPTAFVELKTLSKKSRQTDAQKEFERNVEAAGCLYFIARSPEEIDGVFSALGVINKSVQQPGRVAVGRRVGSSVTRSRPAKNLRVAA